jgi:hypothetical protein
MVGRHKQPIVTRRGNGPTRSWELKRQMHNARQLTSWALFVVILGVSATVANAQGVGDDARRNPSAGQGHAEPKTDVPPSLPAAVQNDIHSIAAALNAANQKEPSQAEKDRAKRDLAAQEGMSKWARLLLFIGGAEAAITLTGVILVWRTLLHTRTAATAAATQAKIAVDAFEKIERPHIYVQGARALIRIAYGGGTFVKYEVGNFGKVAAIIDEVLITLAPSHTGHPDTPLLEDMDFELHANRVREPGEWVKEIEAQLPDGVAVHQIASTGAIVPDLKESEEFFFRVIVRYHGPFTVGHETSACWRLSELTNRFEQWGYGEFNYVR